MDRQVIRSFALKKIEQIKTQKNTGKKKKDWTRDGSRSNTQGKPRRTYEEKEKGNRNNSVGRHEPKPLPVGEQMEEESL